jgi:type VI secretion system secreted protein Hcp
MGIYLKVPHDKGDATEKHHMNWIKLDSISFGSGRPVRTKTGWVASRWAGTGRVSEIHLTKQMDASSVHVFMSTCLDAGRTMEIFLTRAGTRHDKSEIVYLKYKLTHALFTSYSLESSGANPLETLSLNFTRIDMEYFPQDDKAEKKGGIPVWFDQATGRGSGL